MRGWPPSSLEETLEALADEGVVVCRDLPLGLVATKVETTALVGLLKEGATQVVRGDELPLGREAVHASILVVVELHHAVGVEFGEARLAMAFGGGDDLDSPAAHLEGGTDFGTDDGGFIHTGVSMANLSKTASTIFGYFPDTKDLRTYASDADTKKPPPRGPTSHPWPYSASGGLL